MPYLTGPNIAFSGITNANANINSWISHISKSGTCWI